MRYYFGKIIVKFLLILLTRWQVKGRENVPARGPLIVVANHLSLIDPPLLIVSIPRQVVFMAKEEAFHSPILGPIVRVGRAFPVGAYADNLHHPRGLAGGFARESSSVLDELCTFARTQRPSDSVVGARQDVPGRACSP